MNKKYMNKRKRRRTGREKVENFGKYENIEN